MNNNNIMYTLLKTENIMECSKKDMFFLDKAFLSAFHSDFHSSLKLGACIVVNKKKYYTGYNQRCRTTISGSAHKSLHAEIHTLANYIKHEYGKYSIIYSDKTSSNLIIYIVRLMNNPNEPPYGLSKPCKRCETFLYQHNIKYIKYTDIVNEKQVLITLQRNLEFGL